MSVMKHPMAIAWDRFAEQRPSLLKGSAAGIYLENRLREAFSEGWQAAEAAVNDALNEPIEEPTP